MKGLLVSFVAIFLMISLEMMGGTEGKPQPGPQPAPAPQPQPQPAPGPLPKPQPERFPWYNWDKTKRRRCPFWKCWG